MWWFQHLSHVWVRFWFLLLLSRLFFACCPAWRIILRWKLDMYWVIGNWKEEHFNVRIYVTKATSCAVFNVYCSCRCQKLQVPLGLLFLSLLLSLGFPEYFSKSLHLPALSTGTSWYFTDLLVWWYGVGEEQSICLWLNLSLLGGLYRGLWLSQVFLWCYGFFSSPLKWNKKERGGWSMRNILTQLEKKCRSSLFPWRVGLCYGEALGMFHKDGSFPPDC